MKFDESSKCSLHALMPFLVGPAEVLLVPNTVDGADPTVLLVIRHKASTVSHQLTLSKIRQLAAYLNVAADEAEALRLAVAQSRPGGQRENSTATGVQARRTADM